MTEKPNEEKLQGIIYAKDVLKIKDKWRNINIGFLVLLIAVVALLWWIFR
jgi:ABC-type multidrug transport system permease subunit